MNNTYEYIRYMRNGSTQKKTAIVREKNPKKGKEKEDGKA